jgi:putative alpha-1,2-mannosidase
MGFYPLNPCGGDYVLGAPQVPKVVIHLGGSRSCAPRPGGSRSCATADAQERVPPRTFTIIAKNLSKEKKYVKSVTLNGKPLVGRGVLDAPILRHADIMRGGELVFEMTGNR